MDYLIFFLTFPCFHLDFYLTILSNKGCNLAFLVLFLFPGNSTFHFSPCKAHEDWCVMHVGSSIIINPNTPDDTANDVFLSTVLLTPQDLWGPGFTVDAFEFAELMEDEATLLKWLVSLEKKGITLIKNTPQEPKACFSIVNKVGFVKPTHYG